MSANDPLVSLPHRSTCGQLKYHVPPIGFSADEPEWDGEHGESMHPNRVGDQCMCGCPAYFMCVDWAATYGKSPQCGHGDHDACDKTGRDEYHQQPVPDSCECDCHLVTLSEAIQARAGAR